jgi:hypothetical protein
MSMRAEILKKFQDDFADFRTTSSIQEDSCGAAFAMVAGLVVGLIA